MNNKIAQPEVNTSVRLINTLTNSCLLAGPGRGDCEHFVGLPLEETYPETVDHYGRPLGWCQICWQQELIQRKETQLTALTAEVQALRGLVRDMVTSVRFLADMAIRGRKGKVFTEAWHIMNNSKVKEIMKEVEGG